MSAVRAIDGVDRRAQHLLRTVGFLQLAGLSQASAGVILDESSDTAPDAELVLTELVAAGWIDESFAAREGTISPRVGRGPLATFTDHGRRELSLLARSVSPASVQESVTRLAVELRRYLGEDTANGRRVIDPPLLDELIAVVRGVHRCGQPRLGVDLADATWRSASTPTVDKVAPELWSRLCEAGESCATDTHHPVLLVQLLDHSAEHFAADHHRDLAERQWISAFTVARQAGLDDAADQISRRLAALYREWGRLHKSLDVLQNLVDRHRANPDSDATDRADALADLGATYLQANRPADAADALIEADGLLRKSHSGAVLRLHGRVLTTLGRAAEAQGEPSTASRHYSRALALLIDVDEQAAQDARACLARASAAARRTGD